MLNKIILFNRIKKFYNIFGEVVGSNFITKLSDVTADNVHDVLFDINEVRSGYDEVYLNRLYAQVTNFLTKKGVI